MTPRLRKSEVSTPDPIQAGRSIVQHEAAALGHLADLLDQSFEQAVRLLEQCQGSVVVSGMGKAGLIGQKIAATLASTGSPSHFLHPAEAMHGDLGRLRDEDVVLLMSFSGRTPEVLQLLPSLRQMSVSVIAITGHVDSQLARAADVVLWIGKVQEACGLELAPSTSTTAMLALGDALALVASRQRGFTREDFARFHPGGALGRKLARVEDWMRPLEQCRVAQHTHTVRHVLVAESRQGRRSGVILLIDADGQLTGVFTDSDLARLLEHQQEDRLDQPIADVMTNSPATVPRGTMMEAAVATLRDRKVSELPVVDQHRKPIGLLDITDVIAFMPNDDPPMGQSSLPRSTSDDDESPILLPLTNHRAPRRVDEG